MMATVDTTSGVVQVEDDIGEVGDTRHVGGGNGCIYRARELLRADGWVVGECAALAGTVVALLLSE